MSAYNIKLIEIGTQGVKASSSLIIPNLTSCYNEIKRSPKKQIPQCTLKYFPITNVHYIEYARQKFDDFFHFNIKNKDYWRKLMNYKYIIRIFKNKNFEIV